MWRRRRATGPDTRAENPRAVAEARRAREASEERLAEVRQRWPEVEQVATSLRRHRERNGFAELVTRALGGGDSDHHDGAGPSDR